MLATICSAPLAEAELVAHFPMDVKAGQIEETVSGNKFAVEGNFTPENLPGIDGQALRFDGYTSHVDAQLGAIIPDGSTQMTFSVWVALPSYPIIQIDTNTSEQTAIVSCLDTDSKTGFGFFIGFDGKYSFKTYIGGWEVNVGVNSPLPTYQWNNLTAVVDCTSRSVKLYTNGVEVGAGRANGTISYTGGTLYMGQSLTSRMSGPFELMSFNGLIDDISIWNEAKSLSEIQTWATVLDPDLNIPSSRFAEDLLRPRFHGMPAANWTNECHGIYYSDGRYHLFFQKNADGPYMARLHWGHISSDNLYDWQEEKIALAPGEWYDIKGCWSGCIFSDEVVTGGKPNIVYTAVDYEKAMIAQASPESDKLDNWVKFAGNPIIAGKPSGLSDDFRDPYFFRNGDDAYLIVGTSKNNIGATTLHKYNPVSGIWSNTGDIFFQGTSAGQDGRFWEMPNITPMGDGKWLFTATPLETLQGVRTLYWTGTIGTDGKFTSDAKSSTPRLVEMNSKDGFGMLSPTVYQHNGKTIALGIVPDKLSANTNWELGWAHCYSLPREWSLSADGSLIQKPFAGLEGLRSTTSFARENFDLNGEMTLTPVKGRSIEILGRFTVGSSQFGFNIFKNGTSQATITYNPASSELIVDLSALPRLINDQGVYDGEYRCPIPETLQAGSELKLNIFIDHSILDIFINDKWATSIRVFPTESEANDIEAFSSSSTDVKELKAWILEGNSFSGIKEVTTDRDGGGILNVYDIYGRMLKTNVLREDAATGLASGIYIIGNEKVFIK